MEESSNLKQEIGLHCSTRPTSIGGKLRGRILLRKNLCTFPRLIWKKLPQEEEIRFTKTWKSLIIMRLVMEQVAERMSRRAICVVAIRSQGTHKFQTMPIVPIIQLATTELETKMQVTPLEFWTILMVLQMVLQGSTHRQNLWNRWVYACSQL